MDTSKPKLSIITVTYNSGKTLGDALQSVADQDYPNIEHIIVDGLSSDNTNEVVAKYPHVAKYVSEKDEGMYDAINKGLKLCTGQYVGIINSDDIFSDNTIISQVVAELEKKDCEAVYGDVRLVTPDLGKTVRYYSSKKFKPSLFKIGHMPAHPTYYTKLSNYEKYGYYNKSYRIAGDFELLVRHLHTHRLSTSYMELCMINMRIGGLSNKSLTNRYITNKEMVRACNENNIPTNLLQMTRKIVSKLLEYKGASKK